MKRIAAILAALAMLLGASALAFVGQGYPQWDGSTLPQDGFCGTISSERITLRFDPSPDFSNVDGGVVQACFFDYDADESHFIELYISMPQLVMPGDVLRSEDGAKCSVCLAEFESENEGNYTYYYAGDSSKRMSDGSSYEIYIESVEGSGVSLRVTGSFKAQLRRFDLYQPSQETLSIDEGYFDFTMPLSAATIEPGEPTPAPTQPGAPDPTFPSQPDDTEAPGATFPALPQETLPPVFPGMSESPRSGSSAPSFTLPPHYAVI